MITQIIDKKEEYKVDKLIRKYQKCICFGKFIEIYKNAI